MVCACFGAVNRSLMSQGVLPPPPSTLPPLSKDNYFQDNSDGFVVGNSGLENSSLGNLFEFGESKSLGEQAWNEEILGSTTISRFRRAFYQKATFAGGWLAANGSGDLGQSYFRSSVALAAGREENLILMVPTFDVDFLEGPQTVDVPSSLYGLSLNLVWRTKVTSRWGTIVAVRPGFYSDMENSFDDGFRLGGLAALSWDVFPDQLTLFGGAVYLDRNDFSLLPAFGLVWTPQADFRVDLMFPKPKISKRIRHKPFVSEDWVYVASSFGGGTFEVTRADRSVDELTLRDFRFGIGVERITDGGAGMFAELNWVFGRRLEYESTQLKTPFPDSLSIEAGIAF